MAATVTGTLITPAGVGSTAPVHFQLLVSAVTLVSSDLVVPSVVIVQPNISGVFTTTLIGGSYRVSVPFLQYSFVIVVPTSNSTFDWLTLIPRTQTFFYVLTGQGSPVDVITSTFVGELYRDAVSGYFWQSTGLVDTAWDLVLTGAVVHGWFVADSATATSPSDYTFYASFAAALAAAVGFTATSLVWGSVGAYLNLDSTASYVEIHYDTNEPHIGWNWSLGIVGASNQDSGAGSLASAAVALAGASASRYLPANFGT